jgi:CheY-like chemotaxis protein
MTATPPLVLIADDDPVITMMLAEMLEDEGYATHCCNDTASARESIVAERPDLVLIDLHLDRVNAGHALIEWMRQSPATRAIPVIIATGDTRWLADQGDALRAAGCATLAKPFLLSDLLAHVSAALGEHARAA